MRHMKRCDTVSTPCSDRVAAERRDLVVRGACRGLVSRWLRIGGVLCAGAMASACTIDTQPGATSLLQIMAPPSPQYAAELALDEYDPDRRYRGTILLANMSFGGEAVYLELYKDYLDDEDPSVRSAAVRALANHGEPEHAVLIAERLVDPARIVRLEAARGLQRLHNPAVVGRLLVAIREPDLASGERATEDDALVRAEAAHALGQYAESRVVQALFSAIADRSLAVNRNALQSLRTLTGQDFGYDRRAWQAWYNETENLFAGRRAYIYPTFQRGRRWMEYVPFVPGPPNEPASTPVGMPRALD